MAELEAKVTFYSIDQCGYYKWGSSESEFCTLADALDSLNDWARDKTLIETKVYEPSDGANTLASYLLNIQQGNDSWLITMWNEVPSTGGKVASVIATSNVGDADVRMNNIPANSIPGFATYFWFLPQLGVFASIRFQHQLTGQKEMQQYMEGYLFQYSPYVVLTPPDQETDLEILGYAENDGDDAERLQPRFRTSIYKKAGQHEVLLERSDDIRKIIRKAELQLNTDEDIDTWQKALVLMRLRDVQPNDDSIMIKQEVNCSISREELSEIIERWNEQDESQIDDFGFKFSGDSKIYWLRSSLARDIFTLDVERDNDEVVNSQSLMSALGDKRDQICLLIQG